MAKWETCIFPVIRISRKVEGLLLSGFTMKEMLMTQSMRWMGLYWMVESFVFSMHVMDAQEKSVVENLQVVVEVVDVAGLTVEAGLEATQDLVDEEKEALHPAVVDVIQEAAVQAMFLQCVEHEMKVAAVVGVDHIVQLLNIVEEVAVEVDRMQIKQVLNCVEGLGSSQNF